jgi:hypothetical protein
MYFNRMCDLNLLYVIKLLKGQDKTIRIISEITDRKDDEITVYSKIVSDIINFRGEIAEKDKIHGECKIVFSKNKPSVDIGDYSNVDFSKLHNVQSVNIDTFYNLTLLFMGPKMHTISKLLYMTNKLAVAELKYNDPEILKYINNNCFTADPIFFDGCLQLGVLILGIYYNYTGLPAQVKKLQVFDKIESDKSYYAVAFLKSDGFNKDDKSYLIDIILYDNTWKPVMFIHDFKGYVALEVEKNLLDTINRELVLNDKPVEDNSKQLTDNNQLINGKLSFLDNKMIEKPEEMLFTRTLDLNRDTFLKHHVKADIPLFLGATGIEAMAEAATELTSRKYKLTHVSDFAIPYGIKILKAKAKEIFITASKTQENNKVKGSIYSYFINKDGVKMGDPTLHYHGVFDFAKEYGAMQKATLPEFQNIKFEGTLKELLYHPQRLFMDNMFETISSLLYFDNTTLVTGFHNVNNKNFFSNGEQNNFITDIVTLDGMFQTCGVIELLTTNNLVLPYEISSMQIFAETNPENEYICLTRKIADRTEANDYHIQLLDKDNNVLVNIEKMTMIKIFKLPEEFKIYDKVKVLSTEPLR